MKSAIISAITDYLNSAETDYALMINGEWGRGKTYFIENILKSAVEKIDCPEQKNNKNKKTKYRQIYVSLYGVSSIDEIKERMFYAVNTNYKGLEIAASKLMALSSLIPIFGNAIKEASPNNTEKENIRNFIACYDDKIIFFDDLERIDKNRIDIQSVLGYLNYLSEHNHYKIVVVSNDKVLGDEYKQFKEKTIRFSYNYCPDMSEIFDSVCVKHDYNEKYKTFLRGQKQLVLNIFRAGRCENIRTLIFVTDVFKKIFSQETDKYKDEINRDLLIVFIIIAIEAKNGSPKELLKEALQQWNPMLPSQMPLIDIDPSNADATDSDSKKSERVKFAEKLSEQYQKFTNNLTFYPELFDLVFDGYVSTDSSKQMINDVRNKYIRQETSESQMLVNKIVNWTIIPNEDCGRIINDIKKTVSEGNYKVNDILKIYASFIQIESMQISDFSVTSSDTQLFETAIEAAMQGMQYSPYFDIQTPLWDIEDKSDAKDKYNELRNYAVEINKKHKKELNQTQRQKVLNMIQNAEEENLKKFISDINNKCLFVNLDPNIIVHAVISAKAEIKQIFYWGLTTFFPSNLTNPSKEDISFLENIKNVLDEYMNQNTERTVEMANLIYSQKYLDKVLTNYKKCYNQ